MLHGSSHREGNVKRCKSGDRVAGHVARMGEGRGVYRVLVGKPEGKSPLGKPRRRWEDNIKKNLQEILPSPAECYVECDRKPLIEGRGWSTRDCCTMKNK